MLVKLIFQSLILLIPLGNPCSFSYFNIHDENAFSLPCDLEDKVAI